MTVKKKKQFYTLETENDVVVVYGNERFNMSDIRIITDNSFGSLVIPINNHYFILQIDDQDKRTFLAKYDAFSLQPLNDIVKKKDARIQLLMDKLDGKQKD